MTAAPVTAAQLAVWERLIRAAHKSAHQPAGDATELRRAADRAFKTPFPFTEKAEIAPFHYLVGLARLWPAHDRAQRRSNAEAVLRWARACAAALHMDLPPDPPRDDPPRDDPPRPPAVRLPYRDDDSDDAEAA